MTTMNADEFWRKEINKMSASLPEDGNKPPEIESIKAEKKSVELSTKVMVHKIITQVYVFTDIKGKAYTTNTSQKMQVLGTMSLAKALKISQEDNFS